MKHIVFTILFFTFFLTKAQVKETSETELYEKAQKDMMEYVDNHYEKDSTSLRLKTYENFSSLIKNFPKSDKISYYLYTKGTLTNDKEEKINCFKEVIQINNWEYYTRKSYINLCFYAIEEKNFETAKQLLEAIKKMEKPTFTCGNEMEIYYAQLKNLHERCEAGLKK